MKQTQTNNNTVELQLIDGKYFIVGSVNNNYVTLNTLNMYIQGMLREGIKVVILP